MPIYRATSQNPTTNIASQPAGNLAASLFDSMYQTIWNVLNDSSNGFTNLATDTGTINNYVVTNNSPAIAYRQGMVQAFLTANTNNGPSQINVDGLGNVAITLGGGGALTGGEINSLGVNSLIYDGTKFRMLLQPFGPLAGWATITGSLLSIPFTPSTPTLVSNWTVTGSAGLPITPGGIPINVPGPSIALLNIQTASPDTVDYQVNLNGLYTASTVMRNITPAFFKGASTAVFTTSQISISATTLISGQVGVLDFFLGIVALSPQLLTGIGF